MKGFKRVEDKTVGQVLDDLIQGEEYFYKDSQIHLNSSLGLSAVHGIGFVDVGLGFLRHELASGNIYQKVDWTEQLDGTYENGVWCKVGVTKDYSGISKVVALEETYPKYKTLKNHYAPYAEPVSEELAELLEKEMK